MNAWPRAAYDALRARVTAMSRDEMLFALLDVASGVDVSAALDHAEAYGTTHPYDGDCVTCARKGEAR